MLSFLLLMSVSEKLKGSQDRCSQAEPLRRAVAHAPLSSPPGAVTDPSHGHGDPPKAEPPAQSSVCGSQDSSVGVSQHLIPWNRGSSHET